MHIDIFKLLAGAGKVDDTTFEGNGADNVTPIHVSSGGADATRLTFYSYDNAIITVELAESARRSFIGPSSNLNLMTINVITTTKR